jgi:hypothetical protein
VYFRLVTQLIGQYNTKQSTHVTFQLTGPMFYHLYVSSMSFLCVSFGHMRYTRAIFHEKIFFMILESADADLGYNFCFGGVVQKKNRNAFSHPNR